MAESINRYYEKILEMCDSQETKQAELARRLGEDIRLFSQRMRKTSDFKLSKFTEMAESLGYTVIVRKSYMYRLCKESYEQVKAAGGPDGKYFQSDSLTGETIGMLICDGDVIEKHFDTKEEYLEWMRGIEEAPEYEPGDVYI